MKKLLTATLLAATLLLTGCAKPKEINGVTYDTYGLLNKDEKMNPNIQYEMSTGAIICAIIFSETLVIPVYLIGFDLYEPVGVKDPNTVKGQVGK